MKADDPVALDVMRRAMVARIATLSGTGRPSINPLYFVRVNGNIWLGTADWTLAARNVNADPRVIVVFAVEQDSSDRRVLRVTGRARVRSDAAATRSYNLRAARKYLLTPGAIRNAFAHRRQFQLRRRYYAQSAEKGGPCVIEVVPEHVELLND